MNLYTSSARVGKRGFTLIELLVVIAIIGVLSAVALAGFNSARQKSRDARRLEDIRQIRTALELYYATNRTFPATLGFGATSPLVAQNFIPAIPSDPSITPVCSTGAEAGCYKYAGLGSGAICSNYHLGSVLENALHPSLNGDADLAASNSICTGSAADFSGADSGNVYDILP